VPASPALRSVSLLDSVSLVPDRAATPAGPIFSHPYAFQAIYFYLRSTATSKLAKGTIVEGRICYSGVLHIDGWVKGSALATRKQSDTLVLGKSARVDGKLESQWVRLL